VLETTILLQVMRILWSS